MFRNMNSDGRLSGRPSSSSSPTGPGITSVGVHSQESSWMELLFRPSLVLQKLVPGRLWGSFQTDTGGDWSSEELRTTIIHEESELLKQLDGLMPVTQHAAPHLSYWRREQAAASALTEPQQLSPLRYTTESLHVIPQDLKAFVGGPLARTRLWPDSFVDGEASSQRGLMSKLSQLEGGTRTGAFHPETPAVFVRQRWIMGENSGLSLHKEAPMESPPTVQETEVSIAPPSSGQDSLEEDPTQRRGNQPPSGVCLPSPDADSPESATAVTMKREESAVEVRPPSCQNKDIAFIMGCPCSDDSQSESSDDDDDDGVFDSEGLSDLTTSDEEEEAESAEEEEDGESQDDVDSDSDRLWNSLCHFVDPYDPRNFTAPLHTGTVLAATPPSISSTQSSPASSPASSFQDSWDDSASNSEVDEESTRLLNSFSCSSDPYSPLNFTAPLRTRQPQTPTHPVAFTPKYQSEGAEERLDSGFSEPPTSSNSPKQTCRRKKVRFCEQVEEFFASCEEEEDRRGPWEELARDRCRFLRRCQEVEQSIAYCLQPQHRRQVYQRLTIYHVHNT